MQFWKRICLLLIVLFCPIGVHAKIVFLYTPTPFGKERAIYVMDDNGRNKTRVFEGKPYQWNTQWTPTGQIFFSILNTMHRINPDGTGLEELADLHDEGGFRSLALSPDGKKVVFDRVERIDGKLVGSVHVLEIGTGQIRKIADDTFFAGVDWSPDGRQIVYPTSLGLNDGTGGNSLWVMNADGRKKREIVSPPPAGGVNISLWEPHWSPDSQRIVYTQEDWVWEPHEKGLAFIRKGYSIVICDKNGKTIRRLDVPKNLRAAGFAWMDGGKSIVFNGREKLLNKLWPKGKEYPPLNIYKYDLRTDELVPLTNHPGDANCIDWIRDDVLPVDPRGKKKVMWGAIKE
ncbi:hypothetical protein C6501_17735 [Candidatus Poribacteria bacterium]|nr:MAG: hypothetical protein C6501_17735 [Candidatus Poribacteria bacterium]